MEYINCKEKYTKNDLEKVISAIKAGKIVILPTDTVYGISCDALNEKAVKRIYDIKNRDISKPCSILVSDIEMIRKFTKGISKTEEKIIDEFLPGALTLVLEKNELIPEVVTSKLDTVGIRIPNNKFLLDLIYILGRPIVSTSLNLSGEECMINLENLPNKIKENIDLAVDTGNTEKGSPSTIVRVTDGKIKILREGPISKEELQVTQE